MSFGNVKKQAIASDPATGGTSGLDPCGGEGLTMNDMKSGAAHFGLSQADPAAAVDAGSPVVDMGEHAASAPAAPAGETGGSEVKEANRRRYERATVLWTSRILFDDEAVHCVIINISAEGAMVQVSEKIEVGDSAIIKNERIGAFAGKVVWKSESQIGLSFFDDPEEIALVLGRVLP